MNVFSLCHHRIDFSSSPSSYRLAYSSDYRIAPISPYASPPPHLLSSPRSTTTIPPIYYPPNRPRPPSSISRIELRGPPRDDSILFRPSVQSHWPWQIILRRSPPPPPPPTPPRVGRGRSDARRCRRPQVPSFGGDLRIRLGVIRSPYPVLVPVLLRSRRVVGILVLWQHAIVTRPRDLRGLDKENRARRR